MRSPSGSGAPTSARRASATASAPRSPRGGASARDSLIPHAKASGQYLNSCWPRSRRTRPATRRRSCSTTTATSARARARTSSSCATATIVHAAADRRRSSTASPASRSCRSRATSAIEVVERDIARAELYLADEVFLTGTAAELVPVREVDDHRIGDGEPGEITRAVQTAVRGRAARARRALPRVARPGRGPGRIS